MSEIPPAPTHPRAPHIRNMHYIRPLGSGGTCWVYLYQQAEPQRNVAVKVSKQRASHSSHELFLKEATFMARLSEHPSILSIYSAGVSRDGRDYIVMEYAPGGNYKRIMKTTRLSEQEALDLGVRIASALYTAHQQGIIHRDVKPGNVLVTADQQPVLADFGISASTYQASQAKGLSIPWAAPEIIAHKSGGSESSDIYSLGATLFGLLTGKSPYEYGFQVHSEHELSHTIMTQEPPRLRKGEASEDFERVLRKAMAHSREERYFSALDFARDMQVLQARLYGKMTPLIANDTDFYPTSEELGMSGRMVEAEEGYEEIPEENVALESSSQAPRPPEGASGRSLPAPQPPTAPSRLRSIGSSERQLPPPPKLTMQQAAENPNSRATFQVSGNRLTGREMATGKQQQILVATISALLAIVLAVGLGWVAWRHVDSVGTARQQTTSPHSFSNSAASSEPVPELTNGEGHWEGDYAVFTWTNPKPKPGDSYLWQRSQPGAQGKVDNWQQAQQVKQANVSVVQDSGEQTCIQVALMRADKRIAAQATTICLARP
ncbi:hypothetical protein KIMH_03900 [Bombiscardovia apis]|uniref:non-specific serine/threonine protein kinase n=1 Tax=Bombiscardovia apis TaxID=2932182 RepID=A0ABN6SEZ0_9BIFI|nr:serine/threonine-protein kinase [Bombiscardovia apis]BDR54279.1 hypothetical protein KIMH_03900 [Bombiscardovia apis]